MTHTETFPESYDGDSLDGAPHSTRPIVADSIKILLRPLLIPLFYKQTLLLQTDLAVAMVGAPRSLPPVVAYATE